MGYAPFELNCGYIPQFGTTSWHGHQVYWCPAVHTASAVEPNDGPLMPSLESHMMQAHHANPQTDDGCGICTREPHLPVNPKLDSTQGKSQKLLPSTVGHTSSRGAYTRLYCHVTLEFPPELTARRVHPTFHVSLIQAHIPNDNKQFPAS